MYGARDQDPVLPLDHQCPVVIGDVGEPFSNGQQQKAIEDERKGEEGFSHGEQKSF